MSSVNNIGSSSPVQKIVQSPIQRSIPNQTESPTPARSADRLELSGAGGLLQTLKTNDIRTDKVQSIKAQIEAGTYETDDKLNVATNKLLDDING